MWGAGAQPWFLTANLLPSNRHLAQNPFICDCNLKWLADFLRTNPIETSGARCASPRRLANKRIGQIKSKKFRCSGSSHLSVLGRLGTWDVSWLAPRSVSSNTWTLAGGCELCPVDLDGNGCSVSPLIFLWSRVVGLTEGPEGAPGHSAPRLALVCHSSQALWNTWEV
jgi:hypothetical protein